MAEKAERVIIFALQDPHLLNTSKERVLAMIQDFTAEQLGRLPEAWRAVAQEAKEG